MHAARECEAATREGTNDGRKWRTETARTLGQSVTVERRLSKRRRRILLKSEGVTEDQLMTLLSGYRGFIKFKHESICKHII